MYAKRRQKRVDRLLSQGFTKAEARALSAMKKYPPYVQRMIANRAATYANAKRRGKSEQEFLKGIRDFYRKNNYTKSNRIGVKRIDVWQLFRAWEDRYKATHKDYETPSKKRKTKMKDFDDRSLQHRPGE